ncbi:MAG: hypothetical protein JWN89_418 [Parcubacteria group bacterium]|nr:hypothetical protein [Parcubacteria group bacterium]
MNKKLHGFIALIGFLLSPLTPWNDIFINIPLAYVFASLVSLVSKAYFLPSIILGYWLTNVLGLLMMHYGLSRYSEIKKEYTRKNLIVDVCMVVFVTGLLVVLVTFGVLKFPTDY